VALVLSLLTGYVSVQFHLKHDDFFETVRDVNAMPQSKRQELAQFTPEEMTGKPPYHLLVKTTSDRSGLSQITLQSIMISLRIASLSKGAMMILNCPCSKKVTAWMIRKSSWVSPSSWESSLTLFWYYHSIRESFHSPRTLHGASPCSA
jgi:hypothetical protein